MQGKLRAITLTACSCGLAADQLTKYIATLILANHPPRSFVYDALRLQYVENHGGFLGYLNSIPENIRSLMLTAGVACLLILGIVFLRRSKELDDSQIFAGAFLFTGGVGNLIDRLVNNGGVIDFINIGIGPLRTGIFNLADVYILAAATYLGYNLATGKKH